MQNDRLNAGLAWGLSIGLHLILLFAMAASFAPVQELNVDPNLSFRVPVVFDFDAPISVPQSKDFHGDQLVPKPQTNIQGGVKPKIVDTPVPGGKVMPLGEGAPAGAAQPVALPGDRDIPATLNAVAPVYPKEALSQRWQGTVIVDVEVDDHGKPKWVNLVKSSGYQVLDDSLIRTIRMYYTFKPKRVMGQDKEGRKRISYTFEM